MRENKGRVSRIVGIVIACIALVTLPISYVSYFLVGTGEAYWQIAEVTCPNPSKPTPAEHVALRTASFKQGAKYAVIMSLGSHVPISVLLLIVNALLSRSIDARRKKLLWLGFCGVCLGGAFSLSLATGYVQPHLRFPKSIGPAFVLYLSIAAACACVYGIVRCFQSRREPVGNHAGDPDEPLYATAAKEVASKNVAQGVMAKATAEADGDEKKAVARYIKYRVAQLKQEMLQENAQQEEAAGAMQRASDVWIAEEEMRLRQEQSAWKIWKIICLLIVIFFATVIVGGVIIAFDL